MKLIINRRDFVRELQAASAVVEKRSRIPILLNVALTAEEGRIAIQGTDLDVAISTSCAAEVLEVGAVTLPTAQLLKTCKALRTETLSLESDVECKSATHRVNVKIVSGEAEIQLDGLPIENWPEVPKPQGEGFVLPAQDLARMINRTFCAISTEESRFTLNGALFTSRNGRLTMCATDEHRLALAEADFAGPEFRALVSRKALANLLKLIGKAGEEVHFWPEADYVHFQLGTRILTARRLVGSFPDYERALPRDASIVVLVNGAEMAKALTLVKPFTEDDEWHRVTVAVEPGRVKLSANGCIQQLPAAFEGEGISIDLNASYLLDCIRTMKDSNVEIRLKSLKEAAEFRIQNDNHLRHVIMPLRN